MTSDKEKEGRKGIVGAALGWLFGGGGASSVGGGAAGSLGSAAGGLSGLSWLSGLFATKTGIIGALLGGATIAAGVGVIYNFAGPSSNAIYTPQLFQNTYYEEEVQRAGLERASERRPASAAVSTIEMFKEQAEKEGLGGSPEASSENPAPGAPPAAAGAPEAEASAAPPAVPDSAAPGAQSGAIPKMQSLPGFGSKGGAVSSMLSMGGGVSGISGGVGHAFAPVYRQPAGLGKVSAMQGALAAKISNAPKYTVPNFNKRGAFGQAKYASKTGSRASYMADASTVRSEATDAFSGESIGTGDVGLGAGGVGLGGGGVVGGEDLKSSDLSLNMNNTQPPPDPTEPEDESPWEKYMMAALAATGLWAILYMLGANLAKAGQDTWARIVAAISMIPASVVGACGAAVLSMDQKWMGIMYITMCAIMNIMSLKAAMTGYPEDDAVGKAMAGAMVAAASQAKGNPVEKDKTEKKIGPDVNIHS